MSLYYDWDGHPITMERWVYLWKQKRHFGETDLGEMGRVSTVWLGLDHSWGGGVPIIFETMVFGGPMDAYCDRYATAGEARIGHEFVVMQLTSLAGPQPKRKPLIHKGGKPKII
jgi:hypothetical protein